MTREEKNGHISSKKLCNFLPYLAAEVTRDDGENIETALRIGGVDEHGKCLPQIDLEVEEFLRMQWPLKRWGAGSIIEVGRTNGEYIRNAIQGTALYAEKTTVFTCTGWVEINGEMQYLLPGDPRYVVELEKKLSGYKGEQSCEREDLEAAWSMLAFEPAPRSVLLPLIAYTYLTPLCHFMNEAGCDPKFPIFLLRKTGTRKSTLAALILSHFGNFTNTNLHLSFRDTSNSVLYHLFPTKDVITCVDDFHPGTAEERSHMNKVAQAVMRAYGDRNGKGRLTSDITARDDRAPRGNAILTGEVLPNIGESGAARYFLIELEPGDVDLDALSYFQQKAEEGVLHRAIYAYTQWIKEKYLSDPEEREQFLVMLKESFLRYRGEYTKRCESCHGRVPEMAAHLRIGMEMCCQFYREKGIASEKDTEAYLKEMDERLTQIAEEQEEQIEFEKPTHKFIRMLMSLLESQRISLLSKDDREGIIPLNCVGYQDEDLIYLFFDPAFRVVHKFYRDMGDDLILTAPALRKEFMEEGLVVVENGSSSKYIRFGPVARRVMRLIRSKAQEIYENSD